MALRGLRDDSSALVSFMSKHVRDPRYSKDAIAISGMLLDIVGPLDDSAVAHGLHVLRERANEEIKACERLLELGGMVDMLMASSMAGL